MQFIQIPDNYIFLLISNQSSIFSITTHDERGVIVMQTTKQEAINAINTLPDNASIEDIMYRLYVIDKIKRGQAAVKNGETITVDKLKQEIKSW